MSVQVAVGPERVLSLLELELLEALRHPWWVLGHTVQKCFRDSRFGLTL